MPINKNHEFEDMDGIKCAVVEKDANAERVAFIKPLLEFNGFEVIVIPTPVKPVPAAKPAVPVVAATEGEDEQTDIPKPEVATPPPPETFTIGVTDVMFNATNAVFGRLLRTPNGQVVTLAYWNQQENISQDEIPYFEKGEQ